LSKIALSGNASGTGTFTLASPNSNSDRTLNLPDNSGTVLTSATTTGFPAGSVIQVVNVQTGAVATGTTTIPFDDTIPQNNEGTEFMTLAITPTSASSKLKIDFSTVLNHTVGTAILNACLFQDAIGNALAVASSQNVNSGGPMVVSGSYYMTAGTTSSTTFKIRCGSPTAGTVTLNGINGVRFYAGVSNSFITITEVAA
jgi:hypothetical protein